jgi:hypothetical protein
MERTIQNIFIPKAKTGFRNFIIACQQAGLEISPQMMEVTWEEKESKIEYLTTTYRKQYDE